MNHADAIAGPNENGILGGWVAGARAMGVDGQYGCVLDLLWLFMQ